ncbi:MAG: hypothetical protein GEU90_06370 [Gemmatimonas sp.]|nr:hypothetical protein [Gemmatimonas sp.]
MRNRIVIAGSLAQRPGKGGHAWVFLQYLLGFQRLGWDVLFLDRLEPEMCYDASGEPAPLERSENLHYLLRVIGAYGLEDSFAVLDGQGRSVGLSKAHVIAQVRESALLINVMGFLQDPEILDAAPTRVFLDIDPGFPQMWQDLGLARPLSGHDRYVTIGENIGRPDCTIPTCGIDWITTPQPVVLDEWRTGESTPWTGFAGVGAWRGPFAPIEYRGATYGLRVHEFRNFFDLPRATRETFTIALDIDPADARDIKALHSAGWSVVKPQVVVAEPWTYREFIHRSSAEFMVAKGMYVRSNSGWFSDRSICFLASGRPVLAQETGFSRQLPVGNGLIAFSTLEEAADGAAAIAADPRRHGRAALSVAREHFDSDRVLTGMLEKLGVA